MKADCLVGLQYGSEGKGKWAGVLAKYYDASVRVGAPNAGHTVYHEGRPYKMRQIPCAWVNPDCHLYVGAAGLISVEVLAEEFAMLPEEVHRRLHIDFNAGVLQPYDRTYESQAKFNEFNGSTSEGVGSALSRKVLRQQGTLAATERELSPYMSDTKRALHDHQSVLIEGTQGYGLCLNHGQYPFVTSRDVLASSLLSDVGVAPRACRLVLGVMRTYPIRVAGNSGPMGAKELDWAQVADRAGLPPGSISERTTVTNRIRRVSEMNWSMLRDACRDNEPDGILISFIDYVDASLRGKSSLEELMASAKATDFIAQVEKYTDAPVLAVSTGPRPEETIFLKEFHEKYETKLRLQQEVL